MQSIQRKLRNSKGITIIEIIISIGIISLLIASITKLFSRCYIYYVKDVKGKNDYFGVSDVFMFIDNKINDIQKKSVEVSENKLFITNYDDEEYEIYFIGGDLEISYYKSGKYKATNVMLKNIKSFSILRAENVIFIKIITNQNKGYEKCIGT